MIGITNALIQIVLFILIVFLGNVNKRFTSDMKITLSLCLVLTVLGFML